MINFSSDWNEAHTVPELPTLRVPITGGTGYISCLTVQQLLNRRHIPVVLDSLMCGAEALGKVASDVHITAGDCRSSAGVIHLAGIVGELPCKKDYKAHYTINIEAARTVVN